MYNQRLIVALALGLAILVMPLSAQAAHFPGDNSFGDSTTAAQPVHIYENITYSTGVRVVTQDSRIDMATASPLEAFVSSNGVCRHGSFSVDDLTRSFLEKLPGPCGEGNSERCLEIGLRWLPSGFLSSFSRATH